MASLGSYQRLFPCRGLASLSGKTSVNAHRTSKGLRSLVWVLGSIETARQGADDLQVPQRK